MLVDYLPLVALPPVTGRHTHPGSLLVPAIILHSATDQAMDNRQIVLRLNVEFTCAEDHVSRAHVEAGLPVLAVSIRALELKLLYGIEGHHVRRIVRKNGLQIAGFYCPHPVVYRCPHLCLCRIGACIIHDSSPDLKWNGPGPARLTP